MQKTSPGRRAEEVWHIYLCWKHHLQSSKSLQSEVSGKWLTLFVLVAYARLAASKTLLQQLLACMNFTLDSED